MAEAALWLLGAGMATGITLPLDGGRFHGFGNVPFAIFAASALGALVLGTMLGLATAARYYFVTRTGERVIADVRKGLFGRILTLDPSFYAHMRTGEVLSRLTTDIALVETLMTTSISYALRNFLS